MVDKNNKSYQMTMKLRHLLELVRCDLKKGIEFIRKGDIEVCTTKLPHALSYYNKEGQGITPINKHMGSDLCYIANALEKLDRALGSKCEEELIDDATGKVSPQKSTYVFDSFEVEPVKVVHVNNDGSRCFEECDPDAPDLECWAVYGNLSDGEVICLADCAQREYAEYIAAALSKSLSASKTTAVPAEGNIIEFLTKQYNFHGSPVPNKFDPEQSCFLAYYFYPVATGYIVANQYSTFFRFCFATSKQVNQFKRIHDIKAV